MGLLLCWHFETNLTNRLGIDSTMRFTLLAAFLISTYLSATVVAQADPLKINGPRIERDDQIVNIRFDVSASTDVEVAILNARGEVVRHLAAGVLDGQHSPPSPLSAGLAQSIQWDGRNDYGEPVPDVSGCTVRVRAGMGSKLDRVVGGDPYAFYSKEMGQGDHAAWRITGLEAKPDGKVYVLGNASNCGPAALRQYDAAGGYLSTVYPPPAGKDVKEVQGWGIYKHADGAYSFQYNDLNSPALSLLPVSGYRGRIANLIPSPEVDRLLLERDHQLMVIRTDGTVPAQPVLEDRIINNPDLGSGARRSRGGTPYLAGHPRFCLSPDRQSSYLSGWFAGSQDKSGRRTGAEASGFWRDGQVFKVDFATRKASPFFALPADQVITDIVARGSSPIGDARYGENSALSGVAVDAEGHVFICDRQNQRIVILNDAADVIREIPLTNPDAIAIHPKSKALFVTTRFGHFHGKGELKLLKFNDWTQDTKPAVTLPLCPVHHYDQPTYLTVAESAGNLFVWVAYTSLSVRVYQDQGDQLTLVKDFYEAGTQRALDFRHLCVDQKTGDVYLPDGFNACFRITDWNAPKFERCMIDEQTPLRALSVAIDAHNRWLYGHADRKAVVRYRLDSKFFSPSPVTTSPDSSQVTPVLSNDWRIGLGHGDRGIAAAPDGSIATLGALGTKADYSGYLRFFQADPNKAPWEGLLFEDLQRVRAGGIRFDPQGNLYVGINDGPADAPPQGYEKDADFQASNGRIYKYAPTGSRTSGQLFPTAPTAASHIYNVHLGAFSRQFTRTPRFGVDGYGRIYYPTSLLPRVSVIDNAGNAVHSLGTYGNRDSLGGLAGDLVPTSDVPLAWPSAVDATDDYIYAADVVNIRVLRIAKTFAAAASAKISEN